MANKDYSEEFLYEYTPKHLKEEMDPERDISSYTRTPARRPSSAQPRRTTQKRTPSRPAPANSRRSTSVSYLKTGGKVAKGVFNKYGEVCMTGLGTIIKFLAFVVGFGIIIVSLILGYVVFSSRSGLSTISLLLIICGTVIGALFFFPIYGIGHIICQNNEILRMLNGENIDE